MPNGWDEFLEKFKRQASSGEEVDPHAVWSEFLQRSRGSARAEALQVIASVVQKAPVEQRASVAVLLASLLVPWEWPPEWEPLRSRLDDALEEVAAAIEPDHADSLPSLLELKPEENLVVARGALVLTCANRLLWTCQQDELPTVATLCDVGLEQVTDGLRRALERRPRGPLEGALLRARLRFDTAVDRYAEAARALNAAVGRVLFMSLDGRLEGPEI